MAQHVIFLARRDRRGTYANPEQNSIRPGRRERCSHMAAPAVGQGLRPQPGAPSRRRRESLHNAPPTRLQNTATLLTAPYSADIDAVNTPIYEPLAPASSSAKNLRNDSTDAAALLMADHRRGERRFLEFQMTTSMRREEEFAMEICDAIRIHADLDEQIFHPAFDEVFGPLLPGERADADAIAVCGIETFDVGGRCLSRRGGPSRCAFSSTPQQHLRTRTHDREFASNCRAACKKSLLRVVTT